MSTEIWALKEVLSKINLQSDPVLILDMGKIKTKFFLFYNQVPVLVKEFFFPAEELSHLVHLNQGVSGRIVDPAFNERLKDLTNEIHQMNLIAKANCQKHIQYIGLTGFFACLPGLDRTIASLVDIPTSFFRPLEAFCPGQSFSLEQEMEFGMASVFAGCTVGLGKNQILNFRKKSFRKHLETGSIDWQSFARPAFVSSLVFGVMFFSLFVQSVVLSRSLKNADQNLEKTVKVVLSKTKGSTLKDLIKDPQKLKKALDAELMSKKKAEKLFSSSSFSFVGVLKKLSEVIPKTLSVNMLNFQFGFQEKDSYLNEHPKDVLLSFAVSSDQYGDVLSDLIKKEFYFLKKEEPTSVILGENEKQIKLTFVGQWKED
jgi:hypothetical protein